MMQTVYRVQDETGRGPFKPGFSHRWVESRPDHDNLRPWPVDFGQLALYAASGLHYGTGCRTIEQLRRWFTASEYATLHSYGYAAVKLDVDVIVAESDTQCLFARSSPLHLSVERVFIYPQAAAHEADAKAEGGER